MYDQQLIEELLNVNSDPVLDACKEIASIQRGEVATIKTGISHLDEKLPSGLGNQMVFIGSRPSMGKTHMASTVKSNLFEHNPQLDIHLLDFSWEMQMKSLVLRSMKQATGLTIREILNSELGEHDADKAKQAISKMRDPRIKTVDVVLQGENFRQFVKGYLNLHQGKEVIILIDHIHVILTKKEIDEFLALCNELKKEYKNLSFLIFFQLKRELELIWRGSNDAKVKPNAKNYVPNSGHIYNTDSLYQFADLIMTMVIPQVVDLDLYAPVHKERNEHLSSHFIDSTTDTKYATLKGRNRIYYNYIKMRLNDDFTAPTMFCDILQPDIEDIITEQYYSDDAATTYSAPSLPSDKKKKEEPVVVPPVTNFNTLNDSSSRGMGFE